MDVLTPLCTSLHSSSASSIAALTDFLAGHPSARPQLAPLSRELADLQMVAGLTSRNGGAAGGASALPPALLDALTELVRSTMSIVAEIALVLKDEDADASVGHGARLDLVTQSVSELIRPIETARIALNLGLDALVFAASPPPTSNDSGLPAYQSTQILEATFTLRSRLEADVDSPEEHVQAQGPIVSEFVNVLQQHIEQTESNLRVPSTNAGPSDASSTHSLADLTPAYTTLEITTPAPSHITLRHIVKKDICGYEIQQVSFFTRASQPIIAVCTLEAATRFYGTTGAQSGGVIYAYNPVDMVFSRDEKLWAFRSEEEGKDIHPRYHDGVSFKKPILTLSNLANGNRLQQLRGALIKPLNFSPDGRFLAVAGAKGRFSLLDVRIPATSSTPTVINCHQDVVTHAVFTSDSRAVVSLSRDGTIRVTDIETRTSLAKLDTDTWKKPEFLGIAPDGDLIVCIMGDTIFHWSHTTGSVESYSLGTRRSREGWPIAISPDCRFLACRNDDGVDLSDLYSGRVLQSIRFQSGFATSAAFSLDGRFMALGKAAVVTGIMVSKSTLDVWELLF